MVLTSLKSRILIAITGIVLVSLASTILFLRHRMNHELSKTLEENARNLLEATMQHVETQHKSILYHKAAIFSRRKTELKNHTTIAFSIINSAYHAYVEGQISMELAQYRVITELQRLRYDNKIGYFWINDDIRPYPHMIMHPTIPELNGRVLDDPSFNCAMGRNENLFKAVVDVSLKKGEGFVDYCWPKPTDNGLSEKQPKLSYVRYFKPWKWIVGTGIYIDDIEKEAQNRLDAVITELNQTITRQRISDSGYVSIINEEDIILVHPHLSGQDGSHLVNPSTGEKLLEQIRQAAFTSHRSLEYVWDKPGFQGEYRFPKIAYISYYKPLGWYIHATVYKEDLENRITALTRSLILVSAVFLVLAVLLSFLVFRSITNPLNRLMASINQTDNDGIPLMISPGKSTSETMALSHTLNTMVFSISASRKALESQRDFSHGIIEGAPIIILGLDFDGTITFVNPAGEHLTGYSKSEIIGADWKKLTSPVLEAAYARQLIANASKTDIRDFEMGITCKSGVSKRIVWSTFAKKDKYGDTLELYLFGNDITERKQAEENLHRLQNYLISIIDSMPSILVGVDETGAVTQWNKAAHQFTGVPPSEALNKPLDIVYPEMAGEMDKVLQSMHSRQIQNGIKHIHQGDNETIYQDLTIYPLVEGEEEGAVIRIDDITEKVRMEELMIQSEKMLSVGGLAAGMAHEINNPLAAMLQTASVMSSRLLDDLHLPANTKTAETVGIELESLRAYMDARGIPRMISNIKVAGQRIATIVNNMLSFSRKSEDQHSSREIPDLVDKTLELAHTDYDLKKRFDFKVIKIIKQYDADLPPVPCEATKIQQVLLNILGNGAQAMFEAETENPQFIIRAHIEKNLNMLQLEIEDNGPGISAQHRSRIFEPFFSTKPVGVGTGLGLSVAYFIIKENHGGELTVDSQPGKGANFIIRLPLKGRKS